MPGGSHSPILGNEALLCYGQRGLNHTAIKQRDIDKTYVLIRLFKCFKRGIAYWAIAIFLADGYQTCGHTHR